MTDLDDRALDRGSRPVPVRRRRFQGRLMWAGLLVLLLATIAGGVWRHYREYHDIQTIA